jgi:hypothetical protein
MSDWKAWAVPLLAGLLTAGALWMAVPDEPANEEANHAPQSTPPSAPPTGEPTPLQFPFSASLGPANETTTFLVIAPRGNATGLARAFNQFPNKQTSHYDWYSTHVAFVEERNNVEGCHIEAMRVSCPSQAFDAGFLAGGIAPADGPRLLQGGYNATRVTAYVFDEAGLLLASNAQAADLLKYTLHGDFTRLPTVAWYLGANSTAPNGTVALPGFAKPLLDRVLPQLDGLPEGGVATARSNAYVNLFGTLFVTVRIDALVLAP